jgi:hypothetical protein
MYLNDILNDAISKSLSIVMEHLPTSGNPEFKTFVQKFLCNEDNKDDWENVGYAYCQSLWQLAELAEHGDFRWVDKAWTPSMNYRE